MTKKERFFKIKKELDILYKSPHCTLDYTTPFELLIATMLAAQCTDARVNIVTKQMFKKYNTPEAFSKLSLEEIEEEIKSTGFYKNKAKNIKKCSIQLLENHNGQVPESMEDLVNLAGVGRKTANVVRGEIFNKPAVVIDTHAKRLTNRMGLTKSDDPVKIEFELKKFIPEEYQFQFCHSLVFHGREICKAQKPLCASCPINDFCPYNLKKQKTKKGK